MLKALALAAALQAANEPMVEQKDMLDYLVYSPDSYSEFCEIHPDADECIVRIREFDS